MRVTVRYFASVREAVGIDRETVDLPPGITTPEAVRGMLRARGEPWSRVLGEGRNVRAAVDQRMAAPGAPLADGAEVAFFPPVTGG